MLVERTAVDTTQLVAAECMKSSYIETRGKASGMNNPPNPKSTFLLYLLFSCPFLLKSFDIDLVLRFCELYQSARWAIF